MPTHSAEDIDLRTGGVTRIVIVDDHALLREGLRMVLLEAEGIRVCAEADGVVQARQAIGEHVPDVVIVDLELRDGNGLDLIKWITREHAKTQIIVATMHDESVYGARVLRAGASGFVNKQLPAKVIFDAIKTVLSGRLFFSDALIHDVLLRTRGAATTGHCSPVETLSDRELEVFRLIGQGRTTREIATSMHLSPSTVDTYRGRLKHKLKIGSNAELCTEAARFILPKTGP